MAGILCVAGCARQARWYGIESAAVAPDGRTVTATIVVGVPGPDGKSCREVTDTDVTESAAEVVIGVEVRNTCEPVFPWEKALMQKGMGYPLNIQLQLTKPLGGRRLVDRATGRELS